jgi:Putative arginyl-tRNA:protein arginylyltransferase
MDKDSIDTFAGFLSARWCNTVLVEFWGQECLLAVAAVDELKNGLSSVYTFFDPQYGEVRGLGTFAVLWQIEWARQRGLPFVYPGYWITESQKMRYKIHFQPIEGLVNGLWSRLA